MMTAQKDFESCDASPSNLLDRAALQAKICAVIERALEVRVADYEDADRAEAGALCVLATEVLGRSLDVIGFVRTYCEQRGGRAPETPSEGAGRSLCDTVDRHQRRPSGLEKIGDLVFFAMLGLTNRLASIDAVGSAEDKWEVISECSGAVREVLKSLSALERAICESEGLEPRSSYYVTELERALATRRAYVRLHQDVVGATEPEGDEIPRRLRRAAAAIAKLVSRDIYISARVHDRQMIRRMQWRIRGWFAAEPEVSLTREAWLREGGRLYRDIANACDLILAINHRAELCAHDAEVLEAVLAKLLARGAGAVSLAKEFPELETVAGRDPDLDDFLNAAETANAHAVSIVVQRRLRHLQGV